MAKAVVRIDRSFSITRSADPELSFSPLLTPLRRMVRSRIILDIVWKCLLKLLKVTKGEVDRLNVECF